MLVPQYNPQGGSFFEILITGKHPRRSNWTPFNMTEDVLKKYHDYNTKIFLDELRLEILMANPIQLTTMIYSMMTITIIFLALQFTIYFLVPWLATTVTFKNTATCLRL